MIFCAGNQFTEAVVFAVQKVGDALAKHFPRRPDDVNELPDKLVGDLDRIYFGSGATNVCSTGPFTVLHRINLGSSIGRGNIR